MVAVKVTDKYPHLPVNARSGLQKLALRSFPTIEQKEFGTPPKENTWKIAKLVRDTSSRPKKGNGD